MEELFTEADIYYLSNTDEALLNETIDCLKNTREIIWIVDGGVKVPTSELAEKYVHQPTPCIPDGIWLFARDCFEKWNRCPNKEGPANGRFHNFNENYPTFRAPREIIETIAADFIDERIADGLIADGIDSGRYHKFLFHYQDCLKLFRDIQEHKKS